MIDYRLAGVDRVRRHHEHRAPVMNRTEGRRQRISPRRTLAVALLAFAAAVASLIAGSLADLLTDLPQERHALWHLLWALLVLPIAFGLHRFRNASPASGWTGRCLVAADLLVGVLGTGQVVEAVGAALMGRIPGFEWRLDYTVGVVVHGIGGVLSWGSLGMLLLVLPVMWVLEVRAVQRPTDNVRMPPAQ